MDSLLSGYVIYGIILLLGWFVYANAMARLRVEKFLSNCAPLYATLVFSEKKTRTILILISILALVIPSLAAMFLIGANIGHAIEFALFSWLLSYFLETFSISVKLSKKYIKPFCRDNPELGEYYKPIFDWLKEKPRMIKRMESSEDVIDVYTGETGDDFFIYDSEEKITITGLKDEKKNFGGSPDEKRSHSKSSHNRHKPSTRINEEVVFAYGLPHGKGKYSSVTGQVLDAAGLALGQSGLGVIGGALVSAAGQEFTKAFSDSKGYEKLNLYHNASRLYGVVPDKSEDIIDVDIHKVRVDYERRPSSNIANLFISLQGKNGKWKTYTFSGVYRPDLFSESIKSAKKGSFDKTIYAFDESIQKRKISSNSSKDARGNSEGKP